MRPAVGDMRRAGAWSGVDLPARWARTGATASPAVTENGCYVTNALHRRVAQSPRSAAVVGLVETEVGSGVDGRWSSRVRERVLTITSECIPTRTLARDQLSPSSELIMTPWPIVPTRMVPLVAMAHLRAVRSGLVPATIPAVRRLGEWCYKSRHRRPVRQAMPLQVRRIITGHDAKGQAIVMIDEIAKNVFSGRPGANAINVWTTQGFPVNNDGTSDEGQ